MGRYARRYWGHQGKPWWKYGRHWWFVVQSSSSPFPNRVLILFGAAARSDCMTLPRKWDVSRSCWVGLLDKPFKKNRKDMARLAVQSFTLCPSPSSCLDSIDAMLEMEHSLCGHRMKSKNYLLRCLRRVRKNIISLLALQSHHTSSRPLPSRCCIPGRT